jgi:HD superfamily phosphohydrolase
MSEKIIRDPVHDVIVLRTDRPLEALLFRLLNAPQVQRLRRVRQLGLASLAYPGADHSRYSHSLGVMETARKMIDRLRSSFVVDPEREAECLVGALLHDLGHGPFSHVFERISGFKHEGITKAIIEDEKGEVHGMLEGFSAGFAGRVIGMMEGRPKRRFYSDILSSQLDADRFDYLLRDNLNTGSQYGAFDLTWLVQAITVDEKSDRLAVAAKGISAVEAYLQSRYHMYRNVYFHKVVRSAEGMVKLALQRARRLAIQERLAWPPREHVVHKALLGQTVSPLEFNELDDVSILHSFKVWAEGDDAVLAGLCRGLLFRKLFKVIDVSDAPQEELAEILTVVADAVVKAGGDADYDLFFDEPARDVGEEFGKADEILVKKKDGSVSTFAENSPLVDALNRQLMFRRIHVAEEFRDVVMSRIAAHR